MTDRQYHWAHVFLLALSAALLALAGQFMFSTFMFYDDEGYMLISLRNFIAHGRLYDDVYTQYGPFPYVFYSALHLVGLVANQAVGRGVTLFAWAACASSGGAFVLRATRNVFAATAALVSTYVYLWIMTSEPAHPGSLIAALGAAIALGGAACAQSTRWRAFGVIVGFGIAALAGSKINIGIFAGISAGAYTLLYGPNVRLRRMAPYIVGAGLCLVPLLLMKTLLQEPWVKEFALLFALLSAGTIAAISAQRTALITMRTVAYLVGAAGLTAILIVGFILYRGTTVAALLDGVLLGPLRHPSKFTLRFPWPPWALPLTGGSCGLAFLAAYGRKRGIGRSLDGAAAVLKITGAAILAGIVWRFPLLSPDNLVFTLLPSVLWIFAWPLSSDSPAARAATSWVALFIIGQYLHPFPVPGSQIAWGSFLILPLAATSATSACQWMVRSWMIPRWVTRWTVPAVVGAFSLHVIFSFQQVAERYRAGRDLGLPGAGPMRLPDNAVALYRILVFNADVHADLLFSFPGMFSFNQWTELPTPTFANATHWFSLLNDRQQEGIVAALAAHPRAVVIRHREHIEFLQKHGLAPAGIIYNYLEKNYVPAFTLQDFQFMVHKGIEIAPFFTAEVLFRNDPNPTGGKAEDTLLKIPLVLPADRKIVRFEILRPELNELQPLLLDDKNSRLLATSIDLHGHPQGVAQSVKFPLSAPHPVELQLYFNRVGRPFPLNETLIVLRGEHGEELALVRLREQS